MKSYFTLLLILSRFSLIAQDESKFEIIYDAINFRLNDSKIIYLDSSITFYRSISQFVSKRKLEGYADISKAYLELTKREIKYLDTKFKKTPIIPWKQNMFPNSIMFINDSLKMFSERTKGIDYFQKHYSKKYFYFSDVIYFRDSTLAIFRVIELMRPVEGYDLLFVYQKVNNKWEKLLTTVIGAW